MADISAEITAFQNAAYGEDVRSALVSLARKINAESYSAYDNSIGGLKRAICQQAYFTAGPANVYIEASGSDILIRWANTLCTRRGGSGLTENDLTLSSALSAFGSEYTDTDSTGATCLKIPDSYVLCATTITPKFSLIPRSSVDYFTHQPLLACVAGRIVSGYASIDALNSIIVQNTNKQNTIIDAIKNDADSIKNDADSINNALDFYSKMLPVKQGKEHGSDRDQLICEIPANTSVGIKIDSLISNKTPSFTIVVHYEDDSSTTSLGKYNTELIWKHVDRRITAIGVYWGPSHATENGYFRLNVFVGNGVHRRLSNLELLQNTGHFNKIIATSLINILQHAVYTSDMSLELEKFKAYINPAGNLSIAASDSYYRSSDGAIVSSTFGACATIKYYIPDEATSVVLYWAYPVDTSIPNGFYIALFDSDGVLKNYNTMYNGRQNTEFTLVIGDISQIKFVGFSLYQNLADQCYAYIKNTGELLFAGSNSKYAGKRNIYE